MHYKNLQITESFFHYQNKVGCLANKQSKNPNVFYPDSKIYLMK